MRADEITLTLPAEEAFHGVAHLVLGGLAVRLDLTFELLEDLELGLDTLLDRFGETGDDMNVVVRVAEDDMTLSVGPFRGLGLGAELERETADALDLRRILNAVCDRVTVVERHDGEWVELAKRVERTGAAA